MTYHMNDSDACKVDNIASELNAFLVKGVFEQSCIPLNVPASKSCTSGIRLKFYNTSIIRNTHSSTSRLQIGMLEEYTTSNKS